MNDDEKEFYSESNIAQQAERKEIEREASGYYNCRRRRGTWQQFPVECLPKKTRAYIEEKAKALNVESAGVAMSILTQAGALVGGAVNLKINSDWNCPPILWTAIVGMSGAKKSPMMKSATGLITDKDKCIHDKYNDDMAEYRASMKRYEQESRKSDCFNGTEPEKPTWKRLTITGATIQGAQKATVDNPKGVFLKYDELSAFFETILSSDVSGGSEWLSGYNGESISTARKTAGEMYTEHSYWAILGGLVPEKLKAFAGRNGISADGTISRFCLVYPPGKSTKDYNATISDSTIAEMKKIMEYLTDIPFDNVNPKTVNFSEEAQRAFTRWRVDMDSESEKHNDSMTVGLISKHEEKAARIALILHLLKAAENESGGRQLDNSQMYGIDDVPQELTAETFREARTITEWILNETLSCYEIFGLIPNVEADKEAQTENVFSKIQAAGGKGLTLREIRDKISFFRKKDNRESLPPIVNGLISAGRITSKQHTTPANGQTTLYYISSEFSNLLKVVDDTTSKDAS